MRPNKDRLISTFISLAEIPSPSLREGKVANFVIKELRKYASKHFIDTAGAKTGGETGNLIIKISGDNNLKPFLLSAHLDTVAVNKPIKTRMNSKAIYSDGSTILGADCKAGIAIIIETIKILKEKKISHPPLELVFTISEENALLGAKNLDFSLIHARSGLIFDNEQPFENIILEAPAAIGFEVKVVGKAAHSGVAPEDGVSAIKVAAYAISGMKLGRIDRETTANIGFIHGGEGINIIPSLASFSGEIRSKKIEKVKRIESHFKRCLEKSVKMYSGKIRPSFEFNSSLKFPALSINEKHYLPILISETMKQMGFRSKFSSSGGGTDANIFNGRGIITPILSTGMRKVHTNEEYLDLKDFFNCSDLTLRIISRLKESKNARK